jgi:hypothetical protein
MPTHAAPIGVAMIPFVVLVIYGCSRLTVAWVLRLVALLRPKGIPGERRMPVERDSPV